jgi:hypothetical protein
LRKPRSREFFAGADQPTENLSNLSFDQRMSHYIEKYGKPGEAAPRQGNRDNRAREPQRPQAVGEYRQRNRRGQPAANQTAQNKPQGAPEKPVTEKKPGLLQKIAGLFKGK